MQKAKHCQDWYISPSTEDHVSITENFSSLRLSHKRVKPFFFSGLMNSTMQMPLQRKLGNSSFSGSLRSDQAFLEWRKEMEMQYMGVSCSALPRQNCCDARHSIPAQERSRNIGNNSCSMYRKNQVDFQSTWTSCCMCSLMYSLMKNKKLPFCAH